MKKKKKKHNGTVIAVFTFLFFLIFGFFIKGISADFLLGGLTRKIIISENIFLGSEELNSTFIVYESTINFKSVEFESTCDISSQIIENVGNNYLVKLTFNDKNCKDNKVFAKSYSGIYDEINLNLISDPSLYNQYLDLNSQDLAYISDSLNTSINQLSVFNNYKGGIIGDLNGYSSKIRLLEELSYYKEFIDTIIQKRLKKYYIPVEGYELPSKYNSKMPNTGRPYRSDITDGIHHSWDIDAPFGHEVVSLDDGIIVRVVNNWEYSDLNNIRTSNVTQEDKIINLDIYRGNQIWIKTMKGEVVMYAHLSQILEGLKQGDYVERGQYLGNIGSTGVPEVGYNDFHLDFSIYENPNYDASKAGTYTIDDYLTWPWKFKGETVNYILEHQYDIFEEN